MYSFKIIGDHPIEFETELRPRFDNIFSKFSFLRKTISFTIHFYKTTSEFQQATHAKNFNACMLNNTIHIDMEESKKRYTSLESELTRLVTHEFVHLFTNKLKLPNWMDEGLAEFYSRKKIDKRDFKKWIDLKQLNKTDFEGISSSDMMHAYIESALAVTYLIQTYSEDKLKQLLGQVQEKQPFEEVFGDIYSISLTEFESDFKKWLENR